MTMGLDQLPTEVLWKLIISCPLKLRLVNRRFYHMHNELYRERTLQIVNDTGEEKRFWSELSSRLITYVKSLDFLRKDARLICASRQEFLDDSWFIIYNALSTPLKCWNDPAARERDSFDIQKPIYSGQCVVPVKCRDGIITKKFRNIPLNAWFSIDKPIASYKIPALVTELRQSQYASYKKRTIQGNIADFVKGKGVYCFNLGELPEIIINTQEDKFNGYYLCPLEIRLVEVGMAPPTYFENPAITFLGYDFNHYGDDSPWIFFQCDQKVEMSMFNPFESYLAEGLAEFTGEFRLGRTTSSFPRVNIEESIEPYFDINQAAIRRFVYKFPRVEQDWNKEQRVIDWRAPHLIE